MTVAQAHSYDDLVEAIKDDEDYHWVATVIRKAKNLTRYGKALYLTKLRKVHSRMG